MDRETSRGGRRGRGRGRGRGGRGARVAQPEPSTARTPYQKGKPPQMPQKPQKPQKQQKPQKPQNPQKPQKAQKPQKPPRPSTPPIAIKMAVRRLPPMMTVADFAAVADPAGGACALWRSYHPGSGPKASQGPGKRPMNIVRHSVAYLGFKTMEEAVHFSNSFNATRLVDGKNGIEYFARVERAAFQTVPRIGPPKKAPAIQGSIESDPDYLSFLSQLKNEQHMDQSNSSAPSLSQTDSLFASAKGSSSGSATPGTAKQPSTEGTQSAAGVVAATGAGGVAEKGRKGKVGSGSFSPGGGIVLTPLMEDVRAKRKERDDRKAPKFVLSARAARRRERKTGRAGGAPPATHDSPSASSGKASAGRGTTTGPTAPANASGRSDRGTNITSKATSGGGSKAAKLRAKRPTAILKRDAAATLRADDESTASIAASSSGPSTPSEKNGVFVVRAVGRSARKTQSPSASTDAIDSSPAPPVARSSGGYAPDSQQRGGVAAATGRGGRAGRSGKRKGKPPPPNGAANRGNKADSVTANGGSSDGAAGNTKSENSGLNTGRGRGGAPARAVKKGNNTSPP